MRSADSGSAEQARTECSEACQKLENVAREHLKTWDKDAWYVFLKTHQCICQRIIVSESVPLLLLNARFASICLQTYRKYFERRTRPQDTFPKLWVWALQKYKKNRFAYSHLLPKMAAAHILEDLEAALFGSGLDQSAYFQVFDDIVQCSDELSAHYGRIDDFNERMRASLLKWLQPLGHLTIWELRLLAFKFWRMREEDARTPFPPPE